MATLPKYIGNQPIGSEGSSVYSGGRFHGFFRDAEGKLVYTKESLSDTSTRIFLTDGSVLDDGTDFTKGGRNDADRKNGENYDQWLIDSSDMDFYINNDGFLVAVINDDYNHTGPN